MSMVAMLQQRVSYWVLQLHRVHVDWTLTPLCSGHAATTRVQHDCHNHGRCAAMQSWFLTACCMAFVVSSDSHHTGLIEVGVNRRASNL